MSESYRRQQIRTALTRAGHLVVGQPAGPFGGGGRSDLIVCAAPSGMFIAIEVKDDGKRPTAKQEAFMQAVRCAGGAAFVAHNVAEALAGIQRAISI